MIAGLLFLIVGLAARTSYSQALGADARTAELANEYLLWFIPAMALQFGLVAMGSALRAVGNFKPGMIVSSATVVINMILAPILIFGWGTGRAFGVAGAAISSLIAIVIGVVWLATYFLPRESYLRFVIADWRPHPATWKKMLVIGLPAGFEFAITALYLIIVYSITRPFGPAAQAGFGIGMRIVQAGFMPAVALGFSVAPVAGQNFGAKHPQRVRDTFRHGAIMAAGVMFVLAILCHLAPAPLVGLFSSDPAVIDVGSEYLRIVSYSFVASGVIFVGSSMFQAMGNTIPSLITSGVRVLLVAIPSILLAKSPGFQLRWIWFLSVGSVLVQLVISMLLLRREFGRRLNFEAEPGG
ncbi:MAG: MATE family efflux transporter [Gemmatimonadaceae bacterium]